ncbi:unnamed protein product [Alternaria sp. RS040]
MSTTTNKSEQAVAYAALILADESIAITPEKLQTLLKAAGLEDDKNVKEVLTAVTAAPAGRNTVTDAKEDGKVSGEDGNDERDGDEGIDIDADSDDGSAFGDLFG